MKTKRKIEIKQQNRRTLMMRITPSGDLMVLIPYWVKPNSREVNQFIKDAQVKLDPHIPQNRRAPLHNAQQVRQIVDEWAAKMGVKPKRIQLRTMYRKWGSCSTRGTITLNTALYYLPFHLVEYVIVHELAHLFIFDHSPEFWAKVGEFLPDYENSERELDQYRV